MIIEKMISLSTAHITPNTYNFIMYSDMPWYDKEGYGMFLPVSDLEYPEHLPNDLKNCLSFAKKNGCSWVMFDSDVDPVPNLPVYDEEWKMAELAMAK